MRAAVLYGQEDVRIEEVESSALHPGEVRVAISAALTCGTDLKVFKRGYHARMIVPPAVFGHEFAGTLCEIGDGVQGWNPSPRNSSDGSVRRRRSAGSGTLSTAARASPLNRDRVSPCSQPPANRPPSSS